MSPRFIPNPLFGEQYERSGAAADLERDVAEAITEEAKALAPVDTGRYRDSIGASVEREGGGTVGRVLADTDYAMYLEIGTVDTPAFHTLSRAAEAAGLRLRTRD